MATSVEQLACTEIADAIYQVRLPLPFALNHVNCYLLREDDGRWTILDTGLHRSESVAAWQAAFAALAIQPDQIRQIVLTHTHPDHFGMAGALQALTGAPILLSSGELDFAQRVWRDDLWHSPAMPPYFQASGIPAALAATVTEQTDTLRQMTMPYPTTFQIINPGATLAMGGRHFQAIHAPGHSDGQLIFYDRADRLMLCGDQVLIKITPNIGLWPSSEADPLGRYLGSLATLAELDVRVALPGHGRTITDWRGRLQELQDHHAARLLKMQEAVGDGATALEVTYQVFATERFTEHEVRFAVAETLAHLEYLVDRTALKRQENGTRRYVPMSAGV
jgi:glyoxylase-like metal-dependent hydrolase (beta-lactamase superfamily II)